MKTSALYGTRTAAANRKIRSIHEIGHFLEEMQISEAIEEIGRTKKLFAVRREEYERIKAGKAMPSGMDYENWQYTSSKLLKTISAAEWAEKYALPAVLRDIEVYQEAEKAIRWLLRRSAKRN